MPLSPPVRFQLFASLLLAGCVLAPGVALAKRAPDLTPAAAAIRALGSPDREFERFGSIQMTGGVQRQYGLDSHVLRRYWLRSPAMLPTSTKTAREVAEQFLQGHAAELGLSATTLEQTLTLAYEKATPSGTHLRWNQQVKGVPVYRSEIVIKVNSKGQVTSVQNNLRPEVKVPVTPSLDEAAALAVAKNVVKPTGKPLGEHTAELAVVDTRVGARLAWLVSMPVEEPMGDWYVFVDAKSGVVIGAQDRMVHADGTGRVFDPDPRSKMGDSTFVDAADANSAVPFPGSYDIVNLLGITLSAGTYSLDGPFARLIDNESPVVAPVTATHPDSFRYQRFSDGFEDVMCYFHLDTSQRYIQSLGFTNANNRVQEVDAHGLSGADNSHYVPSTKRVAFGEGGVDDDEDADIIWHEYGHSIQDNIVPGWGGGHEGAMGEGFGDYWSGTYSLFKYPGFQPMHFATWDGNGETWNGRLMIDATMHYPEDCCGEVHDSGTLWCSGLTDCLNTLGRAVMDRLVIDHHFALGTTATMADAANQIIQSDIDLYGGAHLSVLVAKLGFWGFVNPDDFVPSISHTPLADVENVTGPYLVSADVTSTNPLAAGSPMLLWGHGASITDSLTMTLSSGITYTASIPGPGVASDVRYYIRATDTGGGTSYSPITAPTAQHVFHAGADVTPPVIVHTAITVAPEISWPANVSATVTDNLGVNTSSVTVDWTLNATPKTAFTLARVGLTNTYTGAFPSTQAEVEPGDVVTYHISALDVASSPNSGRSPAVGENSFTISSALGTVLVLDDDELAKRTDVKVLPGEKDPAKTTTLTPAKAEIGTESANQIAAWLNAMGFVATVEPAATSNSATWAGYSFIVSSSGFNLNPLTNATYRAAVEAHVAAGRKLIVEGGEVGYDAINSPGYATFASGVLHGSTWATDNAGALNRRAAYATHPIATTPNALPATIGMTYVDYASEDSYAPVAPAFAVYGTTTQANNVGISVFDDNAAPQSGQIVVFAFNLKNVTDSTVARNLLENAARFLVAPEPPPTSSITGRVAVGPAWGGAGITVTLEPGAVTTLTDVNGEFTFPGLYANTYSLSATLAGYSGSSRMVTLPDNTVSTDNVLRLFPAASTNVCANPALPIPDATPAGISNIIAVGPAFTVSSVQVSVDITHTWRGDLIASISHGATTVRLHNGTGSSADNLIGTYPTTLTVSGPGALANFSGHSSTGNWTFTVSDNAADDFGTLNQWCIILAGAADTTATVGVDPSNIAHSFEFAPVWPNPVHGGNASLSFALPRSGNARVAIYDVTGRQVRVVADRQFEAGRYVLAWDGGDEQGNRLKPGVYMARLSAAGQTVNRRFVVVQ